MIGRLALALRAAAVAHLQHRAAPISCASQLTAGAGVSTQCGAAGRAAPAAAAGATAAAAAAATPPNRHQQQDRRRQPIIMATAAGPGADRSALLLTPEQQAQLLASVAHRPARVFYHHPCPDGVFAALAAAQFYRQRGAAPRFVPHEVYRPLKLADLQLQADEVAYLLDYSGPEGFPQQLAQHVHSVIVLDHHKTAAQQLGADAGSHPPNLHVCLDMQRSGAAIARDFFGTASLASDSVQQMFRWVEDGDLWRWALPDSQAFHAGLAALRLEYHAGRNPGIWQQLEQLDTQAVLQQGVRVIQQQDRLIADAVATALPYQLGGAQGAAAGWGRALGCVVTGDLVAYRSRLGNSLATRSKEAGLSPVGVVAYVESDMPHKDTTIKVSLRSVDGFDTSAVTGAFGGGGHAAASSCVVPRAELDAWRELGRQ